MYVEVIGWNGTGGHGDCHCYLGKIDENREVMTKSIILHFFSKERTNTNL